MSTPEPLDARNYQALLAENAELRAALEAAEQVAEAARKWGELNRDVAQEQSDRASTEAAKALDYLGQLLRLRDGEKPAISNGGARVLAISQYLDGTYPTGMDPELVLWRRCTKVSEEAGEVQSALRGLVGENPRKGVTHTEQDLLDELLDCAVAALGAVEHLLNDGTCMEALDFHIRKMADRLLNPTERTETDG